MAETCRLSIIIPHYNTPDLLGRLLDSIGRHDDVQVIVVDDHSDLFREKLLELRDRYSYVWFLQTDSGRKGAGAARNAGLRQAGSEWLLFADSDDTFLPGWYDTVSEYLETDADLVFFVPDGRREDGNAASRHLPYKRLIEDHISNRYGSEERLRFRFSVPWSKLLRTDVVVRNRISFDEIPYSNDVMFSAKTGYYSGKILADRRKIYCVTERKGSLTDNNQSHIYLRRMRVICEREVYLRDRLPKNRMDACRRISFLLSLKDAYQRGYGWQTAIGLYRLFRKYRLPFISFSFKRYLKLPQV